MDMNYEISTLIDILVSIQGITLAVVLLVINYRKSSSTFFLGLFILAYSLEHLPEIFETIGITANYPKLAYLSISTTWLLFPLFYIYVKKISILTEKENYWVLYPGIISLALQCYVFFLPEEIVKQIYEHWFYNLTEFIGVLFSLWVGMLTLRWIKKNKKEVQNQFSQIQYKELIWARLYVIFVLSYSIIGLVFISLIFYFNMIIEFSAIEVFFSLMNLMLLYWVALHGLLQQRILNLTYLKEKGSNIQIDENATTKKMTSSILIIGSNNPIKLDELTILVLKLNKYLIKSEAYKKKSLTIIDISDALDVHPKKISTAINTICNQNFNLYINTYRIEKAKQLLRNLAGMNYSVEGIGSEVGFHSKSAFYGAFKKNTKTTPSQFQKEEVVLIK